MHTLRRKRSIEHSELNDVMNFIILPTPFTFGPLHHLQFFNYTITFNLIHLIHYTIYTSFITPLDPIINRDDSKFLYHTSCHSTCGLPPTTNSIPTSCHGTCESPPSTSSIPTYFHGGFKLSSLANSISTCCSCGNLAVVHFVP